MARCSQVGIEDLEATYRRRCEEGDIFSFAALDQDEDEELQEQMEKLGKPEERSGTENSGCAQVIAQLFDPIETLDHQADLGEATLGAQDDLSGEADADQLRALCESKVSSEPFGM